MGFAPKFFLMVCSSPLLSLSLRRNTLLRCGNPQSFTRRSKARFACVRHSANALLFMPASPLPTNLLQKQNLCGSPFKSFGFSSRASSCLHRKRGSILFLLARALRPLSLRRDPLSGISSLLYPCRKPLKRGEAAEALTARGAPKLRPSRRLRGARRSLPSR